MGITKKRVGRSARVLVGVLLGIEALTVLGREVRAADSKTTETQLKAAVEAAVKRLPELEPWQKRIFSEEVIPQYQRFVRDYRESSNGWAIEVDEGSLRNYLAFYAPKALGEPTPKLLVFLSTQHDCLKCQRSIVPIQGLIRSRLSRRGFTPVWIRPQDLETAEPVSEEVKKSEGEVKTDSKLLEEQRAGLEKKHNASGSLWVQWGEAPEEDPDSPHHDEKRYAMTLSLRVRDATFQGEKEILEEDRFEAAEARLLTELFTDLGKPKVELPVVEAPKNGEILIEVAGIGDFAQYSRIRNTLQAQLKDGASLEERKFAKGKVSFAISTSLNREDLLQQVRTLKLDSERSDKLTVDVQ